MGTTRVVLADLTHNAQQVASNFMPLGIGLIGSYLRKECPDVDVQLHKYPESLSASLTESAPSVLGFSNYSWNMELGYAFAEEVKRRSPSTVIVFGGPNYGLEPEELADFWRRFPAIDFYIVREGEVAFLKLFERLREQDFNVQEVKSTPEDLVNAHFLRNGQIVQSPDAPRLESLDLIPSPYLSGLMDGFFDSVLIPLIHTTRGCPFTCTFCTEGSKYYAKVAQVEGLEAELEYIAQRIGTVTDLCLSDANFGMFSQDIQKAETIAEIRARYSWPKRLVVSTGKNQKERVIRVAETLQGALSVAASLQSTDPEVLKGINRSNISIEALRGMVSSARDAEAGTYTELILGLPGDSVDRHRQSLRDVTNAGLGIVRMYQLILLPQTQMSTPQSRQEHDFVTRFRINPRCFGVYDVMGESKTVVEHEEIVIGSRTLTTEEYLDCRQLDLSVEVFHNSGLFAEMAGVFRHLGLDWFDAIVEAHSQVLAAGGSKLHAIYRRFREANLEGVYLTRDDLLADVRGRIDEFLTDTDGTNEMATAKARALAGALDEIIDVFVASVGVVLARGGVTGPNVEAFLASYRLLLADTRTNFLNQSGVATHTSTLDLEALEAVSFELDPRSLAAAPPQQYAFEHSDEQKAHIDSLAKQYDVTTIDGIGRVLMRVNPASLFPKRAPATVKSPSDV
jgi:radical SAM superfamily enzyme YgiQ (UPF0313 family)